MKMNRYIAFTLLGAVALAGASPLLADGMRGHGDRMLRKLDLNGDGGITRVEADATSAVKFLRYDRDSDGAITEAEMLASIQERIARHIAKKFARMDQNGDGRVERSEFDDHGAARFARLDADGDGLVSQAELQNRRHGPRHGAGRGWNDDGLPGE